MNSSDDLINTRQAAMLCHRSPSTLRTWRERGRGPDWFADPMGRIHYSRNEVIRWFNTHKKKEAN